MSAFNAKETGKRLRLCREKAGYSVTRAAYDLAITPDHLRKIERGERNLTLDHLMTASCMYAVSTDYLLKGTGPVFSPQEEIDSIMVRLEALKTMLMR